VLVVDDDGATDGEAALTGALTSLRVPHAVVASSADAATMSAFDLVIWATGDDIGRGQLTDEEMASITEHLAGGGRLVFTSSFLAGSLAGRPGGADWLRRHFGVALPGAVERHEPYEVRGTGDALGAGLWRVEPSRIQRFGDVLTSAGATVTARTSAGNVAAVRHTGDGGAETMLLAFGAGTVPDLDEAVPLLRSVLDHFGLGPGGGAPPGLDVHHVSVPRASLGRDVLVSAVTGAASPELRYRAHGSGAWIAVPMAPGTSDAVWRATIPAAALTRDDVDYMIGDGVVRTISVLG